MNRPENLVIENAKIIFKNFKGKGDAYNREGDRNFCVEIPDADMAEALARDGWNVRQTKPKSDSDYDPTFYIQVRVNFDVLPPNVWAITSHKKTRLTADTIESLDYAEIRNVDLTIRPRMWEIGGKSGIKAYLKNMYVTVEEDEFADKYSYLDECDE